MAGKCILMWVLVDHEKLKSAELNFLTVVRWPPTLVVLVVIDLFVVGTK
jgi:hypothetical protein